MLYDITIFSFHIQRKKPTPHYITAIKVECFHYNSNKSRVISISLTYAKYQSVVAWPFPHGQICCFFTYQLEHNGLKVV